MTDSPASIAASQPLLLALQANPLEQAVQGGAAKSAAPAGAATGAPGAPGPTGPGTPAGPMDNSFFLVILGVLALMLIFSTFAGRRQKKQRQSMLEGLRKHDRVMTSGGIIGSVVELKPRTVVLKVDESSNTRITFSRDAIQQVLGQSADAAPATPATADKGA